MTSILLHANQDAGLESRLQTALDLVRLFDGVLLVEPRVGALASVLAELPFMLGASWFICGRLVRYLSVPAVISNRAAMGGFAF